MAKSKNSAEDKLYNLQAQQLAAQVANWAAQLDFQKERFRLLEMPQFQQGLQLEVDKFAWEKAQQTWERAFQEASITGYYQGQPTTQWLMDQARLTGSYNGERTLEGKLTDAQIQDMHDKMKLANDQFLSATTGYFNGQKTFDRQKFEAAQALEGWKFLATLSGPQNAFKQARAIASAPGGMNQLMDAFAGQYMLPSSGAVGSGGAGYGPGQLADLREGFGGGTGQTNWGPQPAIGAPPAMPGAPASPAPGPPPANLPYSGGAPPVFDTGMMAATYPGYVARGDGNTIPYPFGVNPQTQVPYTSFPAGAPTQAGQGYTYQPAGVQAPTAAWNYSGTADGSVAVYPPGVQSPAATPDVSSQTPQNPAAMQSVVNQPYQYGGAMAPQTTGNPMLAPNQIIGKNYENAYEYQRQLLWANYEDQGIDKGLAQESYLRSLPKYGGVTKGAVAF